MEFGDARLPENFWVKVEPEPNSGCWLWTGGDNGVGHGKFRYQGKKNCLAHRVAYSLLVRPIPDGLTIDHLCRVPACVNPRHLEVVTLRENVLRGSGLTARQARMTLCKRGHQFSARLWRGHRICRVCDNWRRREKTRLRNVRD